jgi:hypothetical protein
MAVDEATLRDRSDDLSAANDLVRRLISFTCLHLAASPVLTAPFPINKGRAWSCLKLNLGDLRF